MTEPKKKISVNRLTYTGQGSELFKMWLVNLLLTIPTLGIYRFWAKAKIRRYQASHVKLGNSFFEHTGNGKELFVGFLKVMAILIGVLVLYMAPSFLGLPDAASGILILCTYVAVFYFLAVARYASIRYMASRTTWRGIRGHLGGSAIKYANVSILRTLINFLTLGLKKPKSDIIKHKFIMDNLQFGAQKFSFQGNSKGLMKPYLIQYSVVFVFFIIGFGIGGVMKGQELIQNAKQKQQEAETQQYNDSHLQSPMLQFASFEGETKTQYNGHVIPVQYDEEELSEEKVEELVLDMMSKSFGGAAATIGGFVLVFYIIFPLIGIALIAPYHTALARKKFAGLKLGDLRFKNTVSAFDFIKFFIINVLIMIFTLTMGKSIIWKRTMQFLCTHVIIGGDLEEFSTKQVALQKASVGEGLGDALDMDTGFDIGL